jgi:hypothetical protein
MLITGKCVSRGLTLDCVAAEGRQKAFIQYDKQYLKTRDIKAKSKKCFSQKWGRVFEPVGS